MTRIAVLPQSRPVPYPRRARQRRLTLAALALLALLASAFAPRAAAADPADDFNAGASVPDSELPAEFMPVDQIRPGMVGTGVSVFQGYTTETFKAEILGVEHGYFAGGDIIYARLSGGPLENHGVAAGMSGSPVYIDGKLIGAVAYGWSFSYKPYCGITPIAQMYTVYRNIGKMKVPEDRRAGRPGAATPSGQPWDWEAAWRRYKAAVDGTAPAPADEIALHPHIPELADEPGAMRPLATPLFLSGASPRTEALLRRFFASRGMQIVGVGSLSGSAGGEPPNGRPPAPPMSAGSAIGVPLLSGDLSLAAVGTTTWVHDGRVLAFGHPMFSEGTVNVPFGPAWMFGIMQSYQSTFKMGEVGPAIGTIDQDRMFAIGGQFGKTPPRVPIEVRIDGPGVAIPRTYHFSCWEDPEMLPTLTLSAIQESFNASVAEGGRLTASFDYRIALADGRSVEKKLTSSSDGAVINSSLTLMLRDLVLLLDNPFARPELGSLRFQIHVQPGYREDALLSVQTDHANYRPGETVRVAARIRPWRGDDYTRDLAVKIPDDLEPGVYVLHITDADGSQRIMRRMHPGLYAPRDFDQLLSLVRLQSPPTSELTLSLMEPEVNLDLRGHLLPGLPGSVGDLISESAPEGEQQASVGRLVASSQLDLGVPVSGSQSLPIEVVSHF